MASPIRFLSGRQQQQKIGIEGSTEDEKVLEVVGRVGIGTTIFEPTSELEVRGDAIVSGILTVSNIVVTSAAGGVFEIDKLRVTGISTFVGISSFKNNLSVDGNLDVDGHTELDDVNVSGASTFTGAIDANGSLDVDGHTELDDVNVSGVSTFTGNIDANGNLDVDGLTELDDVNVSGASTFTGAIDANGSLDVDGHTELDNVNVSGVSTFIGIGTFLSDLSVGGSLNIIGDLIFDSFTAREISVTENSFLGFVSATTLNVSGVSTFTGAIGANGSLDVDGHTELDNVNVSGVSTFAGSIDANGDLDVDGHTELDNVNVSGVSTFTGAIDANGSLDVNGHTELDNVNVSGVSTFTGAIDANGSLDVNGHTELDNVNVSGVSTFASAIVGSAVTINSSGINVAAGIITGTLDNNLTLNTSGTGLSGIATYNNSGASTFTVTSDATDANTASTIVSRDGSGNFSAGTISADLTGVASTATKLGTSRNFSISGDFVTASSVSFDGTGDVSLGATITTNSITLGTYTTGDYVSSISGTSNEIAVSSGTGEGSTPTISFVANPTIGGNVTIGSDLQVNNNLNVTGNITVGGTSATLFTETLRVKDADIVLGFTTNSSGNEVSTDTTANNGGIAIASTEGSPIVSFNIDSIPSTYKNIMWFKTNAFTGLNTDAWLTNYSFGVGTTSMSAGTKFAVGNIEADFDDITSVRQIKASGIITASSFSGDGSGLTGVAGGTALDPNETTNQSQFIPFHVSTGNTDVAGVSTQSFVFNPSTKSLGIGTDAPTSNLHVEGTLNISGVSTFSNNIDANGSLDVDGHTELDNVNVSGVSTFSDDVRFVGAANTDVVWDKSANSLNFEDYAKATFGDGGDLTIVHSNNQSSISESSGSGLEVKSVKVTITPNGSTEKMAEFNANSSVELYFDDSKKLETTGYGINVTGDVNTSNNISIAGVSTFTGNIDANGNLDVDGLTELDDVNVSGASTFTGAIDANGDLDVDGHTELDNVNVSGVSTFAGAIDANGSLDVDGHTELDNVNVSGVSTFAGSIDANGSLDVDGHTELDDLNVSGVSTFASAIVGSAVTISSSGINAATGIITASSLDAAISEWVLGADGTDHYTFSGPGFTGAENDPTIYVVRGQKYNFENKMGAHPFRIQSDPNGSAGTQYNDGITNNDVSNGTLVWDVQFDAPGALYYQCTSHANMGGRIYTRSDAEDSISFNTIVVGGGTTITGSGINAPTGIITATSFFGDGSNLTGLTADDVGALAGISIREEGSLVGSAGSIGNINFVSSNLTATASGIAATITLSDTPTFTSTVITSTVIGSGVTINSDGINATGVITATSFVGSGANLTGITADQVSALRGVTVRDEGSVVGFAGSVIDIDFVSFVSSNLTATSSGIAATITLSDTPTFTSTIIGTGVTVNSSGINATGVITATSFVGNLTGTASGLSTTTSINTSGIITASSLDAAISEWVLGADGTDNYNFTGPGFTGAENDRTIYLVRGQKYNFKNSSGGHPFRIQSDPNGSTGTQYNDGITNNDAGDGVTLNWDVQFDTPEVLYYQCTSHGSMGGKIYIGNSGESIIVGAAVTINSSGINATGVITATSFVGDAAGLTNVPPAFGGLGDKYNTGITTSIYVSITGGIGTAVSGLTTVAANNDIFIGPGIGYAFPSTAGKSYIIGSIHVTNIYNTHLYLTSRHDFNGGENVPTAQRVIVPYQGALEVLEEPIIAKPSDILRFQAFAGIGETSGVGPEAVGVNNGLDSFITYTEKDDADFIGIGVTVTTPAGTELFTSNTNPSVIQSIRLCNYDLDIDVDASVSIYRGGSVGSVLTTGVRHGYLVYNLTVPKNSVIEILERPKYLAPNDTVVVGIAGTTLTNSLSSTLSGKYITNV